jgi:hypothetical protein
MKQISTNMLNLIQEIDQLWEPVYPFLAKHIAESYGRNDGVILEIGPFCGVIYTLMAQGVGSSFMIGVFPPEMTPFFNDGVHKKGLAEKISIIETDQSLNGIQENSIDLVIFRGALFFPSLFRVDYQAVNRVMKSGGIAMIGGGFGKCTPPEVIRPIAERSKELNLKIGKIEVTAEQVKDDIKAGGALVDCKIVLEGGLWVFLRKG